MSSKNEKDTNWEEEYVILHAAYKEVKSKLKNTEEALLTLDSYLNELASNILTTLNASSLILHKDEAAE